MTRIVGTTKFQAGDRVTWDQDQFGRPDHPRHDYGDGPFIVFSAVPAMGTASLHPQTLLLMHVTGPRAIVRRGDETATFAGIWFTKA